MASQNTSDPRFFNISLQIIKPSSTIFDDGYIPIPLATSIARTPIVEGSLTSLALGSGLAITLFTIAHAVMAGGKRRKRSSSMVENSEIPEINHEDILYATLLSDWKSEINKKSSLEDKEVADMKPKSSFFVNNKHRGRNRRSFKSSVSKWLNYGKRATLYGKSFIQMMKVMKFDFKSLMEVRSILKEWGPVPNQTEQEKKVEDEELIKMIEKVSEKDMKSHLADIFNNMTSQDCSKMAHICSIVIEFRSQLTPNTRKRIRPIVFGSLNKKTKKSRVARTFLALATILVYGTEDGCNKVANICPTLEK